MTTVVGLDLSLTGTGIARIGADLFDGTYPRVTTTLLGSKPAGDNIAARVDRITDLAGDIVDRCYDADLVCIERPAYSSNTGSVTDRAGLFIMVCARLIRGLGIPVVDVVNNHLKMYAVGKGGGKGADKDAVLTETVRRYGHLDVTLNNNNTADALQLAALGWHHLTGGPLVDLPVAHTRAVTAVTWPSPNGRNTA